ncbi:MAG TPA: methyltransferase domain-containing protein [Planctomycetota bacterium]|nr:methyltransferase domain-containing protein [Planctomycetota bacterium]
MRAFEQNVLGQTSVPPSHYDEDYFHSQWRAGDNNYSLETRRAIEGRNPALIKEVFAPRKALDFGCGPGVLLYLLREIDVDCEGLDFSPYAKESAPAEVRDLIQVRRAEAPVRADPLRGAAPYDLVICREVLEHLTVLQIQRAVESMCALSSRFIYITTRYAKAKNDLLALEQQPEVDPTHMSLLNKEFLRCLFILQGFRSRRDLEQRMDWKGYGRVLVLEKLP